MVLVSCMRRLTCCTLLAVLAVLVATASARPSSRKRSGGDALQMQAVEDFVEAVLAERAGDWDKAVRSYEDANRKSPHANTYFNIADLYRRMEQYDKAIASYRKYLELSPRAPDRAAVEQLIAQLEQTPGRLYVSGEDLDGMVFLDGKLLGPSPQLVTIADTGRHQLDRVSPTHHHHRIVVMRPMRVAHARMYRGDEEPGNVVFSKAPDAAVSAIELPGASRIQVPGRTQLKPGRHRVKLEGACNEIELDAPVGKEVTFVYFVGKRQPGASCATFTAQQTRVRFPP